MTRFLVVHDGTPEMLHRAEALCAAGSAVGLGMSAESDPALVEAQGADLVICLSPAYPKLWRAPSLLVLRGTDDSAFFDEAGLMRLLSHDGWLVEHPTIEQRLRDVAFGARKHRPYIARWYEASLPPPPSPDGGWFVATSDRPGDLLAQIAAAQRVAMGRDHPCFELFAGLVPEITSAVPPAAIELQLAALSAASSSAIQTQLSAAAKARYEADFAPGPRLRRLAGALPGLLAERGYRGGASLASDTKPWKVAYIIRAGGRPVQFLRRALSGLAAQGLDPLHVVLVLWRSLDFIAGLQAEFPNLHFTIVERPGADRSVALWAGLAAVQALKVDHFGFLDDDDEILPQHLGLLRAAIDKAERGAVEPRPRIFYAAALHCSPSGFAAPSWLPVPDAGFKETIRLVGFQFYDPASTAAHRHEITVQSYLADASLLDEEVLEDPRMGLAEDAYLFKLLAERGLPRFVPDVTSIVHDHGEGQSGFAQSPRTLESMERTSLRMLGRIFPNPRAFSTPGTPVAARLLTTIPRRMTNEALAGPYQTIDMPADGAARSLPFQTTGGKLEFSCIVTGPDAPPVTITLRGEMGGDALAQATAPIQPLAVTGIGEARLAIALPDVRSSGKLVAELAVPAATVLALLAVRNTGEGVKLSWRDVPRSAPLWIYGAGEAGHRALLALKQAGHPGPAGFIDGFKNGQFHGLEIRHPAHIAADTEATIIVASQYWREIVPGLRESGCVGLYSSYPPLDDGLLYLG